MFLHAGIGSMAMLLLLAGAPSNLTKDTMGNVDWFCMVLSSAYCSHQFEEHAFDIFGRQYPFIFHLAHLMHCNVELETLPYLTATGDCGLNEFVILWINVYGIFGAILCPLLLPEHLKTPSRFFGKKKLPDGDFAENGDFVQKTANPINKSRKMSILDENDLF